MYHRFHCHFLLVSEITDSYLLGVSVYIKLGLIMVVIVFSLWVTEASSCLLHLFVTVLRRENCVHFWESFVWGAFESKYVMILMHFKITAEPWGKRVSRTNSLNLKIEQRLILTIYLSYFERALNVLSSSSSTTTFQMLHSFDVFLTPRIERISCL